MNLECTYSGTLTLNYNGTPEGSVLSQGYSTFKKKVEDSVEDPLEPTHPPTQQPIETASPTTAPTEAPIAADAAGAASIQDNNNSVSQNQNSQAGQASASDSNVSVPVPADDPCDPDPCKNGSKCNKGQCECRAGFKGSKCEKEIVYETMGDNEGVCKALGDCSVVQLLMEQVERLQQRLSIVEATSCRDDPSFTSFFELTCADYAGEFWQMFCDNDSDYSGRTAAQACPHACNRCANGCQDESSRVTVPKYGKYYCDELYPLDDCSYDHIRKHCPKYCGVC